ncbi:MAG: hypothetical protein ACTSRZ_10095 [Promethearchaeota archaeon]
MIGGKNISLNSDIVTKIKSFGLEPIYIKYLDQIKEVKNGNNNNTNEIIFDLEPGLEFLDIIDRFDKSSEILNYLDLLKENKNIEYISFVFNESVENYCAIRMFEDQNQISLIYIIKEGTNLFGDFIDAEQKKVIIRGDLYLIIENKSQQDVKFKQINSTIVGFRIESLDGEEVLNLIGKDSEAQNEFVVKSGATYIDTIDFELKIYEGEYNFIGYTSWFRLNDNESPTSWTFPPFRIRICHKQPLQP